MDSPARGAVVRTNEMFIDDVDDANRCVRDLVALSKLPTVWVGGDARQIASGICDALFNMLHPILIYAGIKLESVAIAVDAARSATGGLTDTSAQELGRGFSPWLNARETGTAFSIPNPVGAGMARMTFVPIGHSGGCGFIVAVSHLVNFPSDVERLLLTVGANQVATAIQSAQLLIARRTTAHYEGAVVRLRSCLRDICYNPHDQKAQTLTADYLSQQINRTPHGAQLVTLLGELHNFADHGAAQEDNFGDAPHRLLRDPSDSM